MAESNNNGVHGDNNATFEQSFRRLQEVVQKLSEGNLTLEDALSSFEEGMELADRCTQMLDEAELRLERVSSQVARAAAESVEQSEADIRLRPVNSAARAAAEDLDELDAAIRQSPLIDREEEITFEVTSIEESIKFKAPPGAQLPRSSTTNLAYSPRPGERPPTQPHPPPSGP